MSKPYLIKHVDQAESRLLKSLSQSCTAPLQCKELVEAIGLDNNQYLLQFQQSGLEFARLDNDVCQLAWPLDLLEPEQILTKIPKQLSPLISSIEYHHIIDSTNSALLNSSNKGAAASICLTEFQTAGRGRHGRNWVAPFAAGLCLSFAWPFPSRPDDLQLVSLLPAVALIRVLHHVGLQQAGVKWPNDVICKGQKLAGVLIEMPPQTNVTQSVIMGIGLNVYQRTAMSEQILQPWSSVDQFLAAIPTRNELCSMLISELIRLSESVENEGLIAIRDEWRRYDILKDTEIEFLIGERLETGISRGMNDDGSLTIEINGQVQHFVSGEISLRPKV